MKSDDVRSSQTLNWQRYTYWELWSNPELQAEYDAMLASRPIWPSRLFTVFATAFFIGVLAWAALQPG